MRSIHLPMADGEEAGRVAFYDALVSEFAARGVVIADEAPLIADYALGSSDADMALYTDEAGSAEQAPSQIAEPRTPRWTDNCQAVRLRGSLVVYDRASGTLRKGSTAHSTVCQGDAPPFAELARLLVADQLTERP